MKTPCPTCGQLLAPCEPCEICAAIARMREASRNRKGQKFIERSQPKETDFGSRCTIENMTSRVQGLVESGRIANDYAVMRNVQAGTENPHAEMDVNYLGNNPESGREFQRNSE